AFGVVAATSVLAFATAAAALTVPELITGHSIGKSTRKSTFFGGRHRTNSNQQQTTPTQTTPTQTTTQKNDQNKKQNTQTQSTTPNQGKQKQQTGPQPTTPSGKP